MTLIVERARQIVEDLEQARSRRAFLSALEHFERVLAMAPDYPPGTLDEVDGRALGTLADAVVSQVEERLDHHTDRASVQRSLATTIYQIRRNLEAIYLCIRDRAPAHV